MEVHHPHVEKKSFKEYFLEFIMIFLAVTLGFFAESLREHISDREKENQYVNLLEQDLRKDTAAMHYSIRRINMDILNGDRLIIFYAQNRLKSKTDSCLIQLVLMSGLSVDVIFNDRAASQLKNSGAMRLIRDKEVSDDLLQYWNNQIRLDQIHERFENLRLEHHRIRNKTFNCYLGYYAEAGANDSAIYKTPVKAILDERNLNEFMNVLSTLYNLARTAYLPRLTLELTQANQLIDLIHKNYSLETSDK